MRRLGLPAFVIALLMVAAAPAPAKEGTMFDPRLGALTPGRPADVKLLIMPRYDRRGIETVAPPRPGSTVLIALRSDRTGEVVRFTARAAPSQEGFGFPANARITIPLRRTPQTWTVSVRADGRAFADPMGDKVYVQAAAPRASATAGGRSDGPWPVIAGIGVLLAVALAGAVVVRRHRGGGHDADVAVTRPTG
jgi:hypothetical protein